ncbi:MAG TPA: glycosyltransferase family 4 protein [Ilumatobacteraceae bacterium]
MSPGGSPPEHLTCGIEPLRILLVTDFYWPYLGGVEQHVRSLAHSLVARGHDVTVATLTGKDLDDDSDDDGVRVRRLRSMSQRMPWLFSSAERPWAPPIADPAITWQLRKIILENPPDIVHGHDWLARSFLPLRRWSTRKFGTRFVSSLHYYTLSCAKKNLMRTQTVDGRTVETSCTGPGVEKCLACAGRHYGRPTGIVTATANAIGALAERRGAAAIVAVSAAVARGNGLVPDAGSTVVIPNFLPDGAAHPTSATSDVGALTALLPDEEFMIFVGDLRPMKGLDVLLDAYSTLEPSMPLVLIGKSWPDTPTALPRRVVVHDRWPNAAVIEAFRRSSIAVVPSVWAEPFGIVVIEAMAGGSPVVASAVGGIPEIVEDGVSGLLVAPGDATALGHALAELIGDPQRRAAMGEAARRRAEDFTAARVVDRIEQEYRQLATS